MKSLLLLVLVPFIAIAQESKLSNESQLSIIQTGGNSAIETYNFQTKTDFVKNKNEYEIGGHYVLGTSENAEGDTEESARNWDYYGKYTRDLSNKLGVFLKYQVEGNEFSGIIQRNNSDAGLKYTFIKTDKKSFYSELGLRQTEETRLLKDEDGEDKFSFNKGRVYSEISQKLSSTLSYKFWAEYLPNFTESEDYLINFEPSVSVVLSDNLSFKVSYRGAYDNQPSINEDGSRQKHLDYTTATSLIAKF